MIKKDLEYEEIELKDEKVKLDTDTDGVTSDLEYYDDNIDIADEENDNDDEITEDEEIVDVDEPVENKKDKKKNKFIHRILKYLLITVGIICVLFGGYVIFQNHIGVVISCESKCMEPNIKQGETLVASRLVKVKDIKRNDIIIFEKENKPGVYYTRRVIGLPGEKVEMKNGDVYINGKKIKDPYRGKKSIFGIMDKDNIKLGKNEFFVLCDDRPNIDDSCRIELIH